MAARRFTPPMDATTTTRSSPAWSPARSSMAAPACARSPSAFPHPLPRGTLPATGSPNRPRRFQASRSRSTPDLKVPYAMHTAVGVDRAIGQHTSRRGEFHPRARPVPARHDRLQPDRAVARTRPPAQRHRWPRRHVGVGAAVHVVRRQLVPRPDDVAEQATQRPLPVPRRRTHSRRPRTTSTDFQSAFLPENNGAGRDPANPTGLPRRIRSRRASGDRPPTISAIVSSCRGLYRFPFGLQLASIVTAASGRPFTPLAGADLNGDGDGGAFPSDRARRDPADAGEQRRPQQRDACLPGDRGRAHEQAVHGRGRARRSKSSPRRSTCLNRSNFTRGQQHLRERAPTRTSPSATQQGRVTYGLFEQALPPRQIQLALRFTF